MLQIAMSEYDLNHLSTLSRLSDDNIDHICSSVSCFIEQQMLMRKGVYIFGLGTFTFCQQKLNLGNKHILIQRPIFILSQKLSQYYGFKQIKPQATATRPSVSQAFPGIGVLTFRQSRVKMIFFRDFISALDGTRKLSSALTNRPETSNSRVSERPATFSGATLPRIFAGEPLRKEPNEPSPRHQTDEDDDDDGWAENRQPADRATASDGPEDKRPANTDSSGYLLWCVSQELCYVCMQRAQRNLPLYQSEEKRRAEREQGRVLMLRELT